MGEELGEYAESFVTTGTGTTSSLVCATLVNAYLAPTEFAGYYVLIESGACKGQVGMVSGAGLAKTTGTISTATTFTDAIASGVTFSLFRLVPPLGLLAGVNLLREVNRAARYLHVEDSISFAGVSGQRHYPIPATYPWWTRRESVIAVGRPTTSSDDVPVELTEGEWDWQQTGETASLVLPTAPFATGATFTVRVYRPAYSRLKLNATARATVTGGAVTAVTIVLPGSYAAIPTVTISGGGGTGATATVVDMRGGLLYAVSVGAGGSGYTSAPTVSFTRTGSDTGWSNQAGQRAGLAGLDDEMIASVDDIKTVALWLTYQDLANDAQPNAPVAEWLTKAQQWRDVADSLPAVLAPSSRRTNVAQIRTAHVGGYRRPRVAWVR